MVYTATLTTDLHQALTAAGVTPRRAALISRMIWPAGRHWLLSELQRDPQNTIPRLLHMFRDELAGHLRLTCADTDRVRAMLKTGVVR